MPTNKRGEHYTWKEFFSQWKKGMQDVTPYQQTVVTQFGHIISAIGVIWGIIFSIRLGYYWMMVILIGGLVVLSVQYLGNWQKKALLKQIDSVMNRSENISLMNIIREDK